MVPVAVGGEAARDEAAPPAGDEIERPGAQDPAEHLGGNVAGDLVRREPLAEHEAHGDRGVDMAAGNMPNGVDHRDHGEPEGKRDPEDPNAELRNAGAEERAPAAGEYQPECADRFCCQSIDHVASQERVVLPRTMPGGSKKRKPPSGQACRLLRFLDQHIFVWTNSR
ncbi:MAG: hypothetical protein EWM73_03176 [Nitrospira sp.]|nr:MAG: hypothetical protein EWM73_03176 [Nitrospira sp.]